MKLEKTIEEIIILDQDFTLDVELEIDGDADEIVLGQPEIVGFQIFNVVGDRINLASVGLDWSEDVEPQAAKLLADWFNENETDLVAEAAEKLADHEEAMREIADTLDHWDR